MIVKGLIVSLFIVSLFVLAGCDVYETLYGAEAPADDAAEPAMVDEEEKDSMSSSMEDKDAMKDDDHEHSDGEHADEEHAEEEVHDDADAEDAAEEETEQAEAEAGAEDAAEATEESDAEEETSLQAAEDDSAEVDEDLAEIQDIIAQISGEDQTTPVAADKTDAAVVIVEETEQVSLAPNAEDPDDDTLTFAYTTPLDDNGRWQTSYGDAGEYTITVTASDGELTANQAVLIIVNKKEEAPTIDRSTPTQLAVELEETEDVAFSIVASDLNRDVLSFSWELDGEEVSTSSSYRYQTSFDDAGEHTLTATVTDGQSDASRSWDIAVDNRNRRPVLETIGDIVVDETDSVVITLFASDPDRDALSYTINDDTFDQDGSTFVWDTTYDDAGVYDITVTVTDGEDSVSQDVEVTVENVNRPPVILDIIQI